MEEVLYGRRKSFWLEPALLLVSLLYGVVIRLRLYLYRLNIFRTKKLPCRVISVGNITVGGTGKTPTVIHIARLLKARGMRPAIVSRGYGRKRESDILTVSDGRNIPLDADRGGDEPFLIACKLPGVPVVVGADRYEAGMHAINELRPDVVVLDDGYQHIRLMRDLNIALLDGEDAFGKGRLFPAGTLREPLSALRRAELVLVTKTDRTSDVERIGRTVRNYTNAPIFTARLTPIDLVDAETGEARELGTLRNTTVLAFSGIARPSSFFTSLQELGARLVDAVPFPDHHRYTSGDLAEIRRKAADLRVDLIVTTEKDAVRLRPFRPRDVWSLRIEQHIIESGEWERAILGKEYKA